MYNMHNMHNKNNSEETYYTLLGVTNSTSHDEIKRAYRKLSMDYHPDRNGGNREKSEKFKKITDAYKILGDESERKKYDFSLNNNLMSMGTGMGMGMGMGTGTGPLDIDPDMIMNMFLNSSEAKNILNEFSNLPLGNIMGGIGIPMGGISLGRTPFTKHKYDSKPETIYREIFISLLDAYKGCKIPITITRWFIESDTKIEQTETIYIDIPKGVDDNEIITIKNKGNRTSDTNKGDIEIKIIVKPHDIYERNGIDLIYKKSITLKESFCGFSFDLTYIDGREFKINNEAGNVIPPDFRKIIPKMGMKRDDVIGDLIIIFNVIYPKQFTSEQIQELDKIL